jgi:hypothetical protein
MLTPYFDEVINGIKYEIVKCTIYRTPGFLTYILPFGIDSVCTEVESEIMQFVLYETERICTLFCCTQNKSFFFIKLLFKIIYWMAE